MKRVIAALIVFASVLVGAPPNAQAAMNLPTPGFTQPAEGFGQVGPFSCEYVLRPGVLAFGEMIIEASGYGYQGPRRCPSGETNPQSHHYSGRALDLMIDNRDSIERADGKTFLQWLFRYNGGKLRRLGVVEIIWRGRIWTTARDLGNVTWRTYKWRTFKDCTSTSDPTYCHFDHIHISLSVAGADKLTTFWTAQRNP